MIWLTKINERKACASRSIPACAGEPISAKTALARPQDYPRMCGGTLILLHPRQCMDGLSPHVRGNPLRSHVLVVEMRTIPACAGEPLSIRLIQPPLWDYPRMCGGT